MELGDNNLRQQLNKRFNSLDWYQKFHVLYCISYGLKDIHNNGLIGPRAIYK